MHGISLTCILFHSHSQSWTWSDSSEASQGGGDEVSSPELYLIPRATASRSPGPSMLRPRVCDCQDPLTVARRVALCLSQIQPQNLKSKLVVLRLSARVTRQQIDLIKQSDFATVRRTTSLSLDAPWNTPRGGSGRSHVDTPHLAGITSLASGDT